MVRTCPLYLDARHPGPQIDSNYLSAVTSGLTYLVEKFKDFSGSATINLDGVVRSRLASFAEENL
nr:hypothetical protein [Alteromonas macleodii]